MRLAIIFSCAFAASGCELILGIDEPSIGPAGGGIDPRTEEARLGLPCGEAHRDNGFDGACPGESICVFDVGSVGSPDGSVGFCSPFCGGDDQICFDVYDGPPEGDPSCGAEFLPTEFCTVGFNGGCLEFGDSICPDGLVCRTVLFDGQMVEGCLPMEWSEGGSDGGGPFMNLLGQLCGPDFGTCPPGHTCVTGVDNLRDPAGNGYCSPDCSNDPVLCNDGYSGPPEGEPMCIENSDPMMLDVCVVGFAGGCQEVGNAACPGEMICHTFETTQGPLQGCGGPTWTTQP